MTTEERETAIMTLISCAGEARSLVFEALRCARTGDISKADQYMEQSRVKTLEAHEVQSTFMLKQLNGEQMPIDLLLMHALDHLACACLAQDLVSEIIEMKRGE